MGIGEKQASGKFHHPEDVGHKKRHESAAVEGSPVLRPKQPPSCLALYSAVHTSSVSFLAHTFLPFGKFLLEIPGISDSVVVPPALQQCRVVWTFECPRES